MKMRMVGLSAILCEILLTRRTAENHYSADYPDEEVDSDDEYGRNVYNYREHASDDEYNDMAYSDDEDGYRKAPWKDTPGAGPLHDVYA